MTWQDVRDARVTRCAGCGKQVYGEGMCDACRAQEAGL